MKPFGWALIPEITIMIPAIMLFFGFGFF